MFNYHFDEFTINKDSLFIKGKPVSIPPKELAVLYLLVTHTGEIISKDEIITNVWFGGYVSDESLARCIYVIRKILEETTDNIFISTIYGKGYRFVKSVTKVSREQSVIKSGDVIADEMTLAVFPFNMQNSVKSFIIFDYLMSQHEYFNNECGVTFCPSALTIESKNINASFADLKQAGVNYFITGNEIIANDVSIIRIELVDSISTAVLTRRTVILSMDNTINLINVSRAIVRMLKKLNIGLCKESKSHALSCSAPFANIDMFFLSFNDLIKKFDAYYDLSPQEFYFLTSRYTLLQFLDNQENIFVTRKITDHAQHLLENDATNALAMAIKTIHRSDLSDCQKESLFEVAMMLDACSADIYFYYSCLLIKNREYTQAMQSIDMAIMLDKNNPVYHVLKMIVFYKQCRFDQAIKTEPDAMGDDSVCRVIVKCLRIKIYSEAGNFLAASSTLKLLEKYRTSAFINSCYVKASNQISSALTRETYCQEYFNAPQNSYLIGKIKYLYSVS